MSNAFNALCWLRKKASAALGEKDLSFILSHVENSI